MNVIEYTHIDLVAPTRVHLGRKKATEIDAVGGIRIRKVVDEGGSYFAVDGPGVVPGLEIYTIAGGVKAPTPVLRARGGRASADAA